MPSDPRETHQKAERRLREILFGDGMYEPGVVKGEEQREKVLAELRRMHDAFAEVTQREADLAEELLKSTQRKTTRRRSRSSTD